MKKIGSVLGVLILVAVILVGVVTPSSIHANSSGIDASNYEENREALEKAANQGNMIDATTSKDYTFGAYGRIHIDGWNVEILSTEIDAEGYHSIKFKADEYYVLPAENKTNDVRFAKVQENRTQGSKSYTVENNIGTLRFKPAANKDAYNATPLLVRLAGVDGQTNESKWHSKYVFIDVVHAAIPFNGDEQAAGISFQLQGAKSYLVKMNTDLKVYTVDSQWFKPIETSTTYTGYASSNDFSNRYYIFKGTNRDRSGDTITYDATAFNVNVYDVNTKSWIKKNTLDFYHEDNAIAIADLDKTSLEIRGYRITDYQVQQQEFAPTMALASTWSTINVNNNHVLYTNGSDYNRQWTSTGIDPTYDQFRNSSLRYRKGNIFVSAHYIRTFSVRFVDLDGTLLSDVQSVDIGANAIAPTAPVKDGYTFTGWDMDYTNVQKDLVVSPIYEEIPEIEKVNVTFVDYDGGVLSTQEIDKGSDAIEPTQPLRDGYTFTGWNKAFTNVQNDIVVAAEYIANITPIIPEEPTLPTTPTAPQAPIENVVSTPVAVSTPVVETTPVVDNNVIENVEKQDNIEKQETEKVKNNETPLAKGNDNGSWALFNLIFTIITIVAGLILLIAKHSKEEDDKDCKEETTTTSYVRRRWTKVSAVVVAVLAVVIFIFTENMTLPMVLIDRWTVIMFVIMIVQFAVMIIGRRWKDNNEQSGKSTSTNSHLSGNAA